MKAILAINNLGYIGLNGKLPWKSREDLLHFKKLTMGKSILVGRSTFELMPKLPGRKIIVVSKGYFTLKEALEKKPDWVIGGKMLLESTLDLCEEFHLSIINDNTFGDTFAPNYKDYKGKIIKYNFEIDG